MRKFTAQLWKIEDFVSKWFKFLQGSKSDGVALAALGELDSIRRCLPYLKFIRGDGWERKHWMQLFSLLKYDAKGPMAVSLETLTLHHWLTKAEVLIEKADLIKNLDAEVTANN